MSTSAEAIVLGTVNDDLASLGKYGIKTVHTVKNAALDQLDAQVFTKILADAATALKTSVIIFSNNFNGKAIAPRLSARLKAGLVSGAVALPDLASGFVVKKNVFSGKAFASPPGRLNWLSTLRIREILVNAVSCGRDQAWTCQASKDCS